MDLNPIRIYPPTLICPLSHRHDDTPRHNTVFQQSPMTPYPHSSRHQSPHSMPLLSSLHCLLPSTNSPHHQETDQRYGLFNTVFQTNIEVLSQARFDLQKTLQVQDLPSLVSGGEDDTTNIQVDNAFDRAFNVTANLNYWNKCGAVPLTRIV